MLERYKKLVFYKNDDFISRIKKDDVEADKELKDKLAKRKQTFKKVVAYEPKEPEVPVLPETTATKPIRGAKNTQAGYIGEALDQK